MYDCIKSKVDISKLEMILLGNSWFFDKKQT